MVSTYKHIWIIIMLIAAIIVMPFSYADMGPKPTTDVEIIGFDEAYYFDLLTAYDEARVTVLDADELEPIITYNYYRDDFPSVLNGYRDSDGYASYTLYSPAPASIMQKEDNPHAFHCGYFIPPDIFKIVLVTESGDLIVSSIIEKELFNAQITFDLTNFNMSEASYTTVGSIKVYDTDASWVSEYIPTGGVIVQVVVTVVLTIIVEGITLFAFGYRKTASYLKFLYVNIGKQVLLYVAMASGYLYGNFFGYVGILLLGELIVFITEIVLFRKLLKEKTKERATIYAFVANLASLFVGLIVMALLMV